MALQFHLYVKGSVGRGDIEAVACLGESGESAVKVDLAHNGTSKGWHGPCRSVPKIPTRRSRIGLVPAFMYEPYPPKFSLRVLHLTSTRRRPSKETPYSSSHHRREYILGEDWPKENGQARVQTFSVSTICPRQKNTKEKDCRSAGT